MYIDREECFWDLRNGQACNGETRDDIRTKKFEIIVWRPKEDGEEILNTQKKLCSKILILESEEGIIREEYLTEPVLQFLKCGLVRRQMNSVNL